MITSLAQKIETLRFLIRHRRRFEDFVAAVNESPDVVWRRPGKWYEPDIRRYTALTNTVPGDFAEIGVFQGETFAKLVPIAKQQGKKIHAFDSFRGMDDPGELDWRPKGQFDVGGAKGFARLMANRGIGEDEYHAWEGFIPNCFQTAPQELRFSFVLLDVDNYLPTKQALEWVWPRMNPGAILALDDFLPAHDGEASQAIKEFLSERQDHYIVDFMNCQLALRKAIPCSSE